MPRTLRGIPEWIDDVIVVDDGSTDETAAVARAFASNESRITALELSPNQGVGRAISVGYLEAKRRGVEIAVVMAGDDQMDPKDLPFLVSPVASGEADYVKGNRLRHDSAAEMPVVRRHGSEVLAHLTRAIGGSPLRGLGDAQCGYTALRLEMLEAIDVDALFARYGYPNDLLLRLAHAGARVSEVPVRPIYAEEVSGFRVHQVIVPISTILGRGLVRRLNSLS